MMIWPKQRRRIGRLQFYQEQGSWTWSKMALSFGLICVCTLARQQQKRVVALGCLYHPNILTCGRSSTAVAIYHKCKTVSCTNYRLNSQPYSPSSLLEPWHLPYHMTVGGRWQSQSSVHDGKRHHAPGFARLGLSSNCSQIPDSLGKDLLFPTLWMSFPDLDIWGISSFLSIKVE